MSNLTFPVRAVRRLTSNRARRGATALEYALVLAFVAVAVLGALTQLGGNLTRAITTVGGQMTSAAGNNFRPR